MVETAQTWEQDGSAQGEGPERSGGADAPFLPRRMLVFPDVSTGSLLREDVADQRTDTTGKAAGDARLNALGTAVWSVVSARANARIQRAAPGLACLRMPACLPLMPDIVQRSARA